MPSNCPADLKEPAVINVRNEGAIIEFSPEQTERMPAIRDLAAGLLFKMRHLNVVKRRIIARDGQRDSRPGLA